MELLSDILLSLVSGGVICALVQLLLDLTRLTPARILVLLVTLGVLLYAVGAYSPMRDLFGTGVTLPLIGFGAAIARGVREAVDATGITGILTGGLTASSGGITAALMLGLLASLVFRPGPKRT